IAPVRLADLELVGGHDRSIDRHPRTPTCPESARERRLSRPLDGHSSRVVVAQTDTFPSAKEAVTAFAHPVEREIARVFDEHGIEWLYEPRTIVLERTLAQEVNGV